MPDSLPSEALPRDHTAQVVQGIACRLTSRLRANSAATVMCSSRYIGSLRRARARSSSAVRRARRSRAASAACLPSLAFAAVRRNVP